jgi:hypothetical protein
VADSGELATRCDISRASVDSATQMAPDPGRALLRDWEAAPAEPWRPWSSPLVWARLAAILLVLIAIDGAVFALIWWLVAVILRHI